MGFINPIDGAERFYLEPGVIAGSTSITASGKLRSRGSAIIAGSTTIEADSEGGTRRTGRALCSGSTSVVAVYPTNALTQGSTSIEAAGRVNNEANKHGAAACNGQTLLAAAGRVNAESAAYVRGATLIRAQGSTLTLPEDTLLILVDVVDADESAALSARLARLRSRMTLDGSLLPVNSFSYDEPQSKIGASLTMRLSRPALSLYRPEATLNLSVGVFTGAGYSDIPLLRGGRLAGYSYNMGTDQRRPTDSLSFSATDDLADRAQAAPSRNIIYYDPASGEERPDAGDTTNSLSFKDGTIIRPLYLAVDGLNLYYLLREAYVTGCGFADVVTNVENFPVKRAEFTLDGGYDGGVRSLLALFEPEYSVDANNVLWIQATDRPLSPGAQVIELPASALVTGSAMQEQQGAPERISGIIVAVTNDPATPDFIEVTETPDPQSTGTFGTEDFLETSIVRRSRKYYVAPDPTIIREDVIEIKTSVHDHRGVLIARTTQTELYDSLNRKRGHTRTEEGLLPDPANPLDKLLQTTAEETVEIVYGAHPRHPRQSVPFLTVTRTKGLVFTDKGNTYLEEPFKLSYKQAHQSGQLDKAALEAGDQTVALAPLTTKVEQVQIRSDGQLTYQTFLFDWLKGGMPSLTTSQPRVGEIGFDPFVQSTQRVVLTLPGLPANRRFLSFGAEGLPRARAISEGYRLLRRKAEPPARVTVTLPFISRIRKGALVRPAGRTGTRGIFMVVSRRVDAQNLGSRASASITTTLECVKVNAS